MVKEKVDEFSQDETPLKFGRLLANPLPSDAIVISGMSGVFPAARNIDELRQKLMSKTDMITATYRPGFNKGDIPLRNGTLPEDVMTEMDAGYFGMHRRMPDLCNPGSRLQFEKVIEAIYDAGMSPKDFEQTNTGHFIGMSTNEKEYGLSNMKEDGELYAKGVMKSVVGSYIAHQLKLKGPVMVCDTACSTSLHAFDHAYRAIRQGECEAAIVSSVNMCLAPRSTMQFVLLGVLSPGGKCSAFDESGNGYVRSEAVCAVLLQKAKDAKRIYAQVIHSKTNSDGFKEQGITFPNSEAQQRLMDECCRESNVGPDDVSYVEAHGTGTSAGDPAELGAVDAHIARKRKNPLLIGSVKSSIGHSEPTAGLCSIVKVLLALEEGIISPNLHYQKPRNIPGLLEGRLKVVCEQTKLPDERAIMCINSFGFGGSNCHLLLKAVSKLKVNGGKPKDNLPRLVCVSGRTKHSVHSLLDDVSKDPVDSEYVRLLQNSFRKDDSNHIFKGYSIISKDKEIERSVVKISLRKPPLRLAFGKINDWYSLANDFLDVPIFYEPLQRIKSYLEKEGLSFDATILNTDPEIRVAFDEIGRSVVSICIADTLKQLEIEPASATDHWFGNYMCAYFEDKIDFNQLLGCILKNKKITRTIQDIGKQKREEITAPADLHTNGFHQDNCKSATMLYCNKEKKSVLLNSQFFVIKVGESSEHSDEDAEVISFQTFTDFLSIIGRLYELGYTLPIEKIFPKVEFPVSRGTPMISSKIKWNHERVWDKTIYCRSTDYEVFDYDISLKSKEWSFVTGHMIDGRVLFPAAGYLWLARISLLKTINENPDASTPMQFRDCRFIRATHLTPDSDITLKVTIAASGYFEIVERDSLVVSGEVHIIEDVVDLQTSVVRHGHSEGIMNSSDVYKELRLRGYNYTDEFRCIEKINIEGTTALIKWNNKWIPFIDNAFQMMIVPSDTRLLYVPTSIDELNIYPTVHSRMIKSLELKENANDGEIMNLSLPAHYNPCTNTIRCGGLEVNNLLATSIKRRKYLASPVLEIYQFIPNITNLLLPESVRVNAQIILENSLSKKLKVVELIDDDTSPESAIISPVLQDVLGDQPLIQADITVFSQNPLESSVLVENKKISDQKDNTLVIASKLIINPKKLRNVLNSVKDGGYIITRESLDLNCDSVDENGITVLTIHRNMQETFMLLRKKSKTKQAATFINIDDDENQQWLKRVKSAVSSNEEIILFSHKNELSGLLGFLNCLRREPGGNYVTGVIIMDDSLEFVPEDNWCKQQLDKQMAINVYKDGTWGTYRHLELETVKQRPHHHAYVNQLVKGNLKSLAWLESALSYNVATASTKSNFIEIHYAALNFRDVMVASGKISLDVMGSHRLEQECVLGFEFSGTNSSGQRFMGMVSQGALATSVMADKNLLWKVPDAWSLADAATVPVVYGTIIYALTTRGEMRKGDSILIHSGTGGVGQAAIRYALYHGCTVFTTVGDDRKKEFLMKLFPQLKNEHIGNSHDQSFEKMIRKQTGGRGVDIVLNSLAEDKLMASVRCLAAGGRFLEIGKFDILMNKPLCTLLLQKNASFHGIMLDRIFDADPVKKRYLGRLISEGIQNQSIQPLSKNVFKCNEVEQAFRFMAGGKHMGKVLIEVREEQAAPQLQENRITSIPRYYCQADKSYVIAGGLGGFGLELVDWLIMRGARKLVLSSRTGIKTGYQKSRMRIWKSYGTEIDICTADITTKQGCRKLIEDAKKLGPVAAVFNLAVVLQDALFENQTEKMFELSLAPKAGVTKYLDELTRELCPDLSKFIVFSSVSCGRGNPGQTNYGMANSIMERICERRRRYGYPALAIQWGAIGEVGLVADMQEAAGELEISGTLPQRLQSCMEVLDEFLTQDVATIVSSMVVAEKKTASSGDDIITSIAAVLGITDIESVSIHTTLPELGMDSMNAVEIKQIIERDLELFLTAQETRMLTFAKLMEVRKDRETQGEDSSKKDSEDVLQGGLKYIIGALPEEGDSLDVVLEMETSLKRDEDGKMIFMIPGLEGFSASMAPLARKLNAHVIAFQYDHETLIDTIDELAKLYSKHMERFLTNSNPFFIIGHSYGAIIALEIVNILETKGYTGIFIAIDGGPLQISRSISYIKDDDDFETNVICQLMLRILPYQIVSKHLIEIVESPTKEEKIEKATDVVQKNTTHSRRIIFNLFNGLIARVRALLNHTPVRIKLRSRVLICRPIEVSSIKKSTESVDMGLKECCGKDVEVLFYEGNHFTILNNVELAVTVNSLLEVS